MQIFKQVGYTARTQAVGLGQGRQNCINCSSIIFDNDEDLLYCTILIIREVSCRLFEASPY